MKARTYLIMMALAISVPILLFSWIGLSRVLQQERESRIHALEETARATALAIDQEIAQAEGRLQILSKTGFLENDDLASLHQLIVAGGTGPDTWMTVYDHTGSVLLNSKIPYGTDLSALRYAWAQEVIDERKTTVSNLRLGQVIKAQVVSVNVPVSSSTGKKYLISQIFHADYFTRFLTTRPISPTWIVGIVGKDGISIARNKNTKEFVGKPIADALRKATLAHASGRTRHITREGIAVYSAFARTERAGWTVTIGIPEAEIEAAATQTARFAALAMLLGFAIAGFGIAILAKRLTKSIDQTVEAAKSLALGKTPENTNTAVAEINLLQAALQEAGVSLAEESQSRQLLQKERERLLESEREARQQAEKQNHAKDEFLAMLGHELRNPLGAITSALTLMNMANVSSEQSERAKSIATRQADHLARIVDDLLDVGRIIAGKIELKKQPIELEKFVQRCVDSQRAIHGNSHAWRVTAAACWVDADPTRLEQIIGNVLGNAVRYTPPSGSIHIGVRSDGNHAIIEVTDNGIGISPELLPRIFDVFVQGPTSIERANGGLGLGLALVKRLLELHGGHVEATSAGIGTGTSFTLRLPIHQNEATHPSVETIPSAVGRQRLVLVVEDNDDGRDMLASVLILRGFKVIAAGNGEEGLDLAMKERPEVAVIDIGLPGISGYDLARELRKNATTRNVRLIALTGYGMEEDQRRAAEAGFDIHLTKPYTLERLLDAMTFSSLALSPQQE